MTRRSSALLLTVLFAVALFLPLAGLAETCEDCVGEASPGCCPPACSLCFCCGPGAATVSRLAGVDRSPRTAAWTAARTDTGVLPSHPRDVFHVPKPA
jgi:hypothetical protein